MTDLLFTIKLTVSMKADEPGIREAVEAALNTACTELEHAGAHEGIFYKIRDVEEL